MLKNEIIVKVHFVFPNGDLVVVAPYVEKYFLVKYLSIFVKNKLATYVYIICSINLYLYPYKNMMLSILQ